LIVDNGEFFEIKHYWTRNLITGFARMGGQTVGIIANNPQDKGGCMSLDASDKMARFVRFCDAFNIPLIWLADCPAYYPSVDEETRGLIRHGSRVIFTNALVTVPQITVVIRKLYGGSGLAMPGKRLGGDLIVGWPTLNRGLMGPEGAVAILYERELEAIKDKAEKERQQQRRIKEMQERLELQQLESTQAIIDPRDTRPLLIKSLKLLANRRQQLPPRKHENIRL
jgi:acetyl-CoA/propionyl-CoA carboxylase